MTHYNYRATRLFALAALSVCLMLLAAACSGEDASSDDTGAYEATQSSDTTVASVTEGELSQAGLAGERLFIANCSSCHGLQASGTAQGPPLVHEIYESGHHSNASFVIAVARGVRQHHWQFGNMPAVPDLSIDEIHQVICYVRELQLANDIIDQIPTSTPC